LRYGRRGSRRYELASQKVIADIEVMATKRSGINGKFSQVRGDVRTRGESYRVAGKTSDGVKILRGTVKPKHFTSRQIREAVTSVVGDRRRG
jgi:hypothetical protein